MTIKKRFIAGAHCPQCQQPDTLRWWMESHNEYVECVECQYQDQQKPEQNQTKSTKSAQMIGIFKP